jgi:hypothetical protein
MSPTFVFPVSGAGPKTFTLQVAKQGTGAFAFNGVVYALYVPFAQDGGPTLAP